MTREGYRHSEEDRAAHATLARWYGEMSPHFRSILSPGDVIVIARAEIPESLRGIDAPIVAVPYSREDALRLFEGVPKLREEVTGPLPPGAHLVITLVRGSMSVHVAIPSRGVGEG